MSNAATQYHVTAHWQVRAPVGAVWLELSRPDAWPDWWRGVVAVELLEAGDPNGLGTYRRVTCRGPLPARLSFNMRTVRLEPRTVIESMADASCADPAAGNWLARAMTPKCVSTGLSRSRSNTRRHWRWLLSHYSNGIMGL